MIKKKCKCFTDFKLNYISLKILMIFFRNKTWSIMIALLCARLLRCFTDQKRERLRKSCTIILLFLPQETQDCIFLLRSWRRLRYDVDLSHCAQNQNCRTVWQFGHLTESFVSLTTPIHDFVSVIFTKTRNYFVHGFLRWQIHR